jgi:hypothetical protein
MTDESHIVANCHERVLSIQGQTCGETYPWKREDLFRTLHQNTKVETCGARVSDVASRITIWSETHTNACRSFNNIWDTPYKRSFLIMSKKWDARYVSRILHWMTAWATLALIGDTCLVRRVSDYRTPQVNFCRLPATSWSSSGFGSRIVPAEAISSHSHTKAHMDNTLIHKHI